MKSVWLNSTLNCHGCWMRRTDVSCNFGSVWVVSCRNSNIRRSLPIAVITHEAAIPIDEDQTSPDKEPLGLARWWWELIMSITIVSPHNLASQHFVLTRTWHRYFYRRSSRSYLSRCDPSWPVLLDAWFEKVGVSLTIVANLARMDNFERFERTRTSIEFKQFIEFQEFIIMIWCFYCLPWTAIRILFDPWRPAKIALQSWKCPSRKCCKSHLRTGSNYVKGLFRRFYRVQQHSLWNFIIVYRPR